MAEEEAQQALLEVVERLEDFQVVQGEQTLQEILARAVADRGVLRVMLMLRVEEVVEEVQAVETVVVASNRKLLLA